ncbi:uncharacterized protein N7459_002684 [Penicillium hispanicum]|uniref:uncharacterized protein n=1 Tax=Penicillium hispanicum TaxID=1080232 RepID=UPI0025422F9F|nr:uncharacterized protein N7459_002684 [Penicillium hispanicum]KAJ5586919.1 hypothetical protein N7459_002684 [Penicillium hispanicum]
MSVANLIHTLQSMAEAETVSALEEQERKQLLQACDQLKSKLESPIDLTTRLIFSGHQAMALRLGVDLKLFDAMAAKANQSTNGLVHIDELAEEIHAEPLLIARLLRFLAAMSVMKEVGRNVYTQTPLAAAYVSTSPLSAALIHSTHFMTVLSRLPEYFHATGWKSPSDGLNGPFQFALQTNNHYFEFLSSHPYYQQAFNTVMGMPFRRRGRDWFEVFPVAERLAVPNDTDPLIVDIGGNQGEDLEKFKRRFPTLPGRCILQDLPAVIEGIQDLPAGLEAQSHDFFQPQPVRNAKVYFMRTVLHDWPDKQAAQILGRVRDAMSQESIVLISETILPESGVLLPSVLSDMQMMGSFASLERTQEQWRALLEKSGLQLVRVWFPEGFDGRSTSLAEQPALLEARLQAHTSPSNSGVPGALGASNHE